MSSMDNIFISYFENGKVQVFAEVTEGNMYNGIFIRWSRANIIIEKSIYSNGKKHGLCLFRLVSSAPWLSICYYNNKNISDQIKKLVRDIDNITNTEKTQIALQFGLVL